MIEFRVFQRSRRHQPAPRGNAAIAGANLHKLESAAAPVLQDLLVFDNIFVSFISLIVNHRNACVLLLLTSQQVGILNVTFYWVVVVHVQFT